MRDAVQCVESWASPAFLEGGGRGAHDEGEAVARSTGGLRRPVEGAGGGWGGGGGHTPTQLGVWGGAPDANAFCVERLRGGHATF